MGRLLQQPACASVSLNVCIIYFRPRSDTTLKSTTTACLSWNRPLTRLLEASLAQSSLTCLKKLSTCWCIMTGKDTSNIRSLRRTHANTHTNKNVWKLARWCKEKKRQKTQNNSQAFACTPTFSAQHMRIHTCTHKHHTHSHWTIYLLCTPFRWVNNIPFCTDLRSLLTMKTILNARRKSMLSTRYVH